MKSDMHREEEPRLSDPESSSSPSEKTSGEAETLADSGFPEGGSTAWLVAVGTAGISFCTMGYLNSFGVFEGWYSNAQLRGHTESQISWIGSLQGFFTFGGGVVGGPLFDLYGSKVIRPAALLYVVSIMLTSVCKQYYQFVLAQGFLGGLTSGMTLFPAMAASPQYFDRKRAAAMGIGLAGSSIGGVIWPIALSKMLTQTSLGFGWSVRIIGFVCLVLLIPSVMAVKPRLPPRRTKILLAEPFQSISYRWLLAAGIPGFVGMFTPLFYLPTYAYQQGMGVSLAFYMASIFNGASFLGRIIPGIMADHLGRFNMLIVAMVTSAIVTFCWQNVHSNAGLILHAVFFGFTTGAIASSMAVTFTSVSTDPTHIGTYMGVGMGVSSISALIGPPIDGALLNNHGFEAMVDFSGAMLLLAAGFVVLAKFYMRQGIFAKI